MLLRHYNSLHVAILLLYRLSYVSILAKSKSSRSCIMKNCGNRLITSYESHEERAVTPVIFSSVNFGLKCIRCSVCET